MRRASNLLLAVFSYMLVGYLVGLIVGFTVFDPDTDVYALLSLVFALVGIVMGIIPFFRQWVYIAFGILIGFYLGAILAILIWGDPHTDDLLEVVRGGGAPILVTFVTAAIGGFFGSRIASHNLNLPALALLLGGFLGGALFVALDIAPSSSMVGVSPFVIGSGFVCALVAWRFRNGLERT